MEIHLLTFPVLATIDAVMSGRASVSAVGLFHSALYENSKVVALN